MNRHSVIRYGIAPSLGIASYFISPTVDDTHPAADLSSFFATCASVLATFFIALALLSLISPLANLRLRQIVGQVTFVYLALGAIAAVAGTVGSWPDCLYRYLFAIAVGTGLGTILAVTRVGIENIKILRDQTHSALAQALGGG